MDATPSTQAVELSQDEAAASEAAADEWPPGAWGRLVSLSHEHPDVVLSGDDAPITLGRHASCTVGEEEEQVRARQRACSAVTAVFESQHLSTRHCSIARTGGVAMVTDTSTNGTYLNGALVGKGNRVLLSHLDELSLLTPAHKSVAAIRYMYKEPEAPLGPLEEYQVRGVLGAGAYATVRLGVHKTTGQQVAIKMIEKKKMVGGSTRADAVHDEVSTLERVSHPNIIRIHGHFETPTTVYLILELVMGGELFDYVVKWPDGLPERTAHLIFSQIADAVRYLHQQGISHRDLKPENILLAQTPVSEEGPFCVKLSDFGLSRLVSDGAAMSTMCGTPTYLAPEVLSKKPYDHSVDVWAMGVILYILLSGKPPFEDLAHIALAQFDFADPVWTKVSREAQDLIQRMLVADPAQRLRSDAVVQHPWLLGTKLPEAPVPAPTVFAAPAPVQKKAKVAGKPPCRYGSACYRKNPQHRLEFWHEGDDAAE